VALIAAGLFLVLATALQDEPERSPADLLRACNAKDNSACMSLAWKHVKGEGVPVDASIAARLYRKVCDTLHAGGCDMLGSLRSRSPLAAEALRDYDAGCQTRRGADCLRLAYALGSRDKKGAEAYVKACDQGMGKACFDIGYRYEQGEEVPKDLARAAGFYEKACEGDDPDTCVNLAMLYQGGGLPLDYPRAGAILDRGCQAGSSLSCFNLASLHKSGTGVPKDPARSAALLAESCRLGFRKACEPDALAPRPTPEPTRVPPLVAEYQGRCDRGEGEACVALGLAAIRGLGGVPQDLSRASELFGASCLRGYDPACDAFLDIRRALAGAPWDMRRVSEYYLGRLHETGRAVARDGKRALEWYKQACEGGEKRGCEAATRMGAPSR
jgi:TPR repeat protein